MVYPRLTEEETEAQGGGVTHPPASSWQVGSMAGLGFEPRWPGSPASEFAPRASGFRLFCQLGRCLAGAQSLFVEGTLTHAPSLLPLQSLTPKQLLMCGEGRPGKPRATGCSFGAPRGTAGLAGGWRLEPSPGPRDASVGWGQRRGGGGNLETGEMEKGAGMPPKRTGEGAGQSPYSPGLLSRSPAKPLPRPGVLIWKMVAGAATSWSLWGSAGAVRVSGAGGLSEE